jgi:hypothetical protein
MGTQQSGGSVRYTGTITWWHASADYGTITPDPDSGLDPIHVHGNNLRSANGRGDHDAEGEHTAHTYGLGDRVTFRLGRQDRRSKSSGKETLEARRVSLLEAAK